jgi:branched-subunit amino acid ABC-type transport system permease component
VSPHTIRTIYDVLSATSVLVFLVLGMAVIVGMMRVFNLCQGELVLLGAVIAYLTNRFLGSVLVGIILAPLVMGVFGAVLEQTVVRRFYRSPTGALLATFAVGLLIRAIVLARMQTQGALVPAPLSGSLAVGGARLAEWRLVIMLVVIGVIAGMYVLLNRTSYGLRVRATLDNRELASSVGISTARTFTTTYAFGAALGGLAGAMIVPLQTLYPNLGLDNLIPMFIAVMVGGLGTLVGPLLGAVAIAVPTALLAEWTNAAYSQVIVIFAAIVFMRLRPAGLLSRTS